MFVLEVVDSRVDEDEMLRLAQEIGATFSDGAFSGNYDAIMKIYGILLLMKVQTNRLTLSTS